MSHATKTAGLAESVLVSLNVGPAQIPDRLTKTGPSPEVMTSSSHPSTHMSLRILKKIAQFDQMIAGFRQRRWS